MTRFYLKSHDVILKKNGNKAVKFTVLFEGSYCCRVKWSKDFKGSRSDDEILDNYLDRALEDAGLSKDDMTNKAYHPSSDDPIEGPQDEAI